MSRHHLPSRGRSGRSSADVAAAGGGGGGHNLDQGPPDYEELMLLPRPALLKLDGLPPEEVESLIVDTLANASGVAVEARSRARAPPRVSRAAGRVVSRTPRFHGAAGRVCFRAFPNDPRVTTLLCAPPGGRPAEASNERTASLRDHHRDCDRGRD
jgi:hypothetical protein